MELPTLIGSIAGIFFPINHQPKARNMKTVETIAQLEELAKEYPPSSDEYPVWTQTIGVKSEAQIASSKT
jgi:hypothetical protein